MNVEIKKEEKGRLIIKHCVGTSGICVRDSLKVCECNIFSGDSRLLNIYEGR